MLTGSRGKGPKRCRSEGAGPSGARQGRRAQGEPVPALECGARNPSWAEPSRPSSRTHRASKWQPGTGTASPASGCASLSSNRQQKALLGLRQPGGGSARLQEAPLPGHTRLPPSGHLCPDSKLAPSALPSDTNLISLRSKERVRTCFLVHRKGLASQNQRIHVAPTRLVSGIMWTVPFSNERDNFAMNSLNFPNYRHIVYLG